LFWRWFFGGRGSGVDGDEARDEDGDIEEADNGFHGCEHPGEFRGRRNIAVADRGEGDESEVKGAEGGVKFDRLLTVSLPI
jgi:hypothetical protein